VEREPDPADRRIVRVRATDRGRRILEEGRRRRISDLAARLRTVDAAELDTLERAAELIERIVR